MLKEDLEKRLDYGEEWGFIQETGNPDALGWVLLSKKKPRPIPEFDPNEKPELYLKSLTYAETVRRHPYVLVIIEQTRDAYESAEYETTEEYGLKETRLFETLAEAISFIEGLGFDLSDIKPRFEIGAP